MLSITVAASAVLMSWTVAVPPVMPALPVTQAMPVMQDVDTVQTPAHDSTAVPVLTFAVSPTAVVSGLGIADWARTATADTIRKPRPKAVVYSDGYLWRVTWHRRLSYAMLPIFAVSYFSGDQMLKKGSDAPDWARSIHGPSAGAASILFGANTFTGAWNLWEGRKDPAGRTRRIVHSVLFTAASAGFVYAGTRLAEDAQQSQAKRLQHRNIAVASMGVSTASWLLMLLGN